MNSVAASVGAVLVAVAGLCAGAGPAVAQTVIGGYRAFIGPADLANSRGVPLTQPWQVIRQDRANVHRFGLSQPGDEGDPWFGSGEMRIALENWLRYGAIDAATAAQIMAGGVTVYVEVLGQGNRAGGVRVTLVGPGGGGPGAGLSGATGPGAGVPGAGGLGGGDLVISPE